MDDIRAARALMENPNLLDDQSAPLESGSGASQPSADNKEVLSF